MKAAAVLKKTGGFTLLELLLAIFIFAIVISALYGAYISTLNVADTTESHAEISNKARTAMDRITADMGSLYLGEGSFFRSQKQELSGNKIDTIAFTSTAHIAFTKNEQPSGFAVIEYKVQQEGNTQLLQLYRVDIPFRPGNMEQTVKDEKGFLLCDGLQAIRFRYYDLKGAEVDDWQSAKVAGKELHVPAMVEIELSFTDAHEEQGPLTFKTAVALPVLKNSESN